MTGTVGRERDARIRAAIDSDPYACGVIDALAADFPDLRHPDVAAVIRKHVYANARTGRGVEAIVDDPFTANWRLVQDRSDNRRVQLACWRLNPTGADRERLGRLNAALAALDSTEGSGR